MVKMGQYKNFNFDTIRSKSKYRLEKNFVHAAQRTRQTQSRQRRVRTQQFDATQQSVCNATDSKQRNERMCRFRFLGRAIFVYETACLHLVHFDSEIVIYRS